MKGKIFVDTNIMIYAHDLNAGAKHIGALTIMETLWQQQTGVISTQVLQEFYVNVTRKITKPLPPAKARSIVENYLAWHIESNSLEAILLSSEIAERYMLSFWDAFIITAARNAQAEKIITEDLNSGQIIEGILIENPFIDPLC